MKSYCSEWMHLYSLQLRLKSASSVEVCKSLPRGNKNAKRTVTGAQPCNMSASLFASPAFAPNTSQTQVRVHPGSGGSQEILARNAVRDGPSAFKASAVPGLQGSLEQDCVGTIHLHRVLCLKA